MLKRFMNWLLHRIQRFLNIFSGQTKKPYSDPTSLDSATAEATRSEPDQPSKSLGSRDTIPNATTGATDLEPSPFIESQLSDVSSPAVEKSPHGVDPAIEPDTYRRLNASVAATPGVTNTTPSFPTDVSDLIDTSQVAKPAVIEEQLPEIHDLLPAVEDSELEEFAVEKLPEENLSTEESVSSSAEEAALITEEASVASNVASSALIGADSDTTDSDTTDSDTTDSDTTDSDTTDSDTTELEPLASQKAVLFSFDIIEHDSEPESSEPTSIPEEPEGPQSSVLDDEHSASDSTTNSTAVDSAITADAAEQVASTKAISKIDQATEQSIEPEDIEGTGENERQTTTDSRASAIDSLPYPWSISVPKQAEPSTPDKIEEGKEQVIGEKEEAQSPQTSSKQEKSPEEPQQKEKSIEEKAPAEVFINSSSEDSTLEATSQNDSIVETLQSSENDESSIVTKKGVVKLLFTLKPGNFHGYIVPNDGTQDILFHRKYINSEVFDTLDRGAHVSVDVKHMEGKAYATKVTLL